MSVVGVCHKDTQVRVWEPFVQAPVLDEKDIADCSAVPEQFKSK